MDENKIIDILHSFSEIYGFEYNKTPVPYIPFGAIRGTLDDGTFELYISRSESRVLGRYHINFKLLGENLVPSGFCIEYFGNPNKKGKSFDERIKDLCFENKINILTPQLKTDLNTTFDRIDEIDEEIFKERSTLRISEKGISLVVSFLFHSANELNTVYVRVVEILILIKALLSLCANVGETPYP